MNNTKTDSGADAPKIKVYGGRRKAYSWKPWQPGYEECPGAMTSQPGGPCPCERICSMCGAGPGKIGIGCLECQICLDPEVEVAPSIEVRA